MIIKNLIILLFLFDLINSMKNTARIKQNRKNNQHKLELYEKCLNNRAKIIEKHQHRQIIECELGNLCQFKSNDCIEYYNPNYQSKLSKWFKSNETLQFDPNKYKITSDNDLIIFDVDFKDKGFYYLISQNRTIINEIYLNVIDKILRKPIYASDGFDNYSNKIVNYLNHSFEIKIIWTEWSDCKCDINHKNNKDGYQTRLGNCGLFTNEFWFPCKSLLKNLVDQYYIMYGECSNCLIKSFKIDNRLNKFDKKYEKLEENNEKLKKTLHITNTHLIMTDSNKYLQLDCQIKLKKEFDLETNVTWIVNYNNENFVLNSLNQTGLLDKSIYIDDSYILNIKSVNSSSTFICFHDDLKKSIFNVKLNAEIPNYIYNYLIYTGIAAVIITLLLVILLSIKI
jgi:hypothetical protein